MKRVLGIFAAVFVGGILLTACGPDDTTCSAHQHKVDRGHSVLVAGHSSTTYTKVGKIMVPHTTYVSPHTYWSSNWQCENDPQQ